MLGERVQSHLLIVPDSIHMLTNVIGALVPFLHLVSALVLVHGCSMYVRYWSCTIVVLQALSLYSNMSNIHKKLSKCSVYHFVAERNHLAKQNSLLTSIHNLQKCPESNLKENLWIEKILTFQLLCCSLQQMKAVYCTIVIRWKLQYAIVEMSGFSLFGDFLLCWMDDTFVS